MKRKETLEATKSQRGVAEAEVLLEDDEKTLINSTMVAAEAEARRGSVDLLVSVSEIDTVDDANWMVDNSISIERDTLDDNGMGMTEDHTKRHEALDNLDYQENAKPLRTDVMSPPQELFHEGRPETVAAASTTAIY
jgi:hypothetical protein